MLFNLFDNDKNDHLFKQKFKFFILLENKIKNAEISI